MKLSRCSVSLVMLSIFFFVVLFGNIGSNLSLIKTVEASGSSEQEDTKRTEEQFVVAILPFCNTDNSGKNEINSEFTEALKKRIEKESPDLQFIILEKSTDHNGGTARSQGREVGANLVIYGETKSEKGKLEEVTYYIVPLSGFEVDPFLLKNPKALAQLSARASYSTIETDPLVLSEIDEENYSALLHAVNSFKEYKKLDFKSALDSFQSIKNYEVNYQLLFYTANCYYFENKLNESCYFYEKALELEPQFKEAMLNQGNTFAFLGSPKTLHEGQEEFDTDFDLSWQAIEMYDRIIEISPQSAVAWNNKGCLLNEMGKPEEALKACQKAIEIDPELELAWRNKGDCLIALDRYEEAVDAYDESLNIDPRNPGAWCGKASTLFAMGEDEKSLEACEKGLEANPRYWGLWQNKGNALYLSDRPEEAQKAYNKALELNPQFAVAWMNKGNIYQETGEADKSLEAYDKALSIDPYYSDAWFNKGNLYYNSENYKEAIHFYDKSLEINPEFEYAWLNKAYAFYYLKKYKDSLEATDKVIQINPKSSDAWLHKGDVLSEMDRSEESNDAYWKALKCFLREKTGV